MWAFTGLSNTAKDVKVSYQSRDKWYKGLTRHSVGIVFIDDHETADFQQFVGQAAVSAPGAATTLGRLFMKTDGKLYGVYEGGTEYKLADYAGAAGVLGSSGWTNAPTVTGALSANSINVNSAGAAAGELKANSHVLSGGKLLLAGTTTLGHAIPYNATLAVDTSTIIGSNVTHGLIYVFNASTGAQFFGMLDGGTSQPQNILTNGAAQWSIGADVAAGSGKIAFYWDGTNYILKNRWSGGTAITLVAMLSGRV